MAVRRDVRQGEIYWADAGEPEGSGPGYTRPVLVIQNDVFNASRIRTVVVCSLTHNLRLGRARGNLTLAPGEAGLPEQSVVNVSQIFTLDKRDLQDLVGALDVARMREVLGGACTCCWTLADPAEGVPAYPHTTTSPSCTTTARS